MVDWVYLLTMLPRLYRRVPTCYMLSFYYVDTTIHNETWNLMIPISITETILVSKRKQPVTLISLTILPIQNSVFQYIYISFYVPSI